MKGNLKHCIPLQHDCMDIWRETAVVALGVTATTTLWFVVQQGHLESAALGMSRRRTTNHSGVVAITPSRPWSIPNSPMFISCRSLGWIGTITCTCHNQASQQWLHIRRCHFGFHFTVFTYRCIENYRWSFAICIHHGWCKYKSVENICICYIMHYE